MKIWLDGKLLDRDDARVSVYDHGLLYGDGVFEGIRIYGGRIFQAHAHMERLYRSAAQIRLAIPYSQQELVEAIRQCMKANETTDAYVRLVVTRGDGNLGLNPFTCPRPTVICIVDTIKLYPKVMYEEGMPVIIAKTIRTSPRMVSPSIKSLNYLNNILAKIECIDAGVPEAVMLNEHGNLAEGTGDNVFIVAKGQVQTPPASAGILVGITREVVMRLCGQLNIPIAEIDITPRQLCAADECFMTGTAAEVIPVTSVDGKPIGDGKVGPITRQLIEAFRKFIRTDEAE